MREAVEVVDIGELVLEVCDELQSFACNFVLEVEIVILEDVS